MLETSLKYWIWLSAVAGLTPKAKEKLFTYFDGPEEIYFASESDYRRVEDLRPEEMELLKDKNLDRASRILDICDESGITVIAGKDALYPRRLSNIYSPPVALFVRGRLPLIDEEAAIAVVGTRRATAYGIKMGRMLGYEITKCGGLVVSGLTEGIDAAGAEGALRAGGKCVGVRGTAIDSPLSGLEKEVAARGALISEYPPGTPSLRSYFRARNRVTSGLSVGTVVVEAPAVSGALLFADEASSQGREVFAVPGNADAPTSAGSNALIKDGAKAVTEGWDILGEFEELFPGKVKKPGADALKMPPEMSVPAPDKNKPPSETGGDFLKLRVRNPARPEPKEVLEKQLGELSEAQLKLISVMNEPEMHIDDIIDLSGLPASSVLAELTRLQIKGYVSERRGKRFSLNIITK